MFEYIKPDVLIISFVASEKLATEEETTENQFPFPGEAEDMSFGEGVEDWG